MPADLGEFAHEVKPLSCMPLTEKGQPQAVTESPHLQPHKASQQSHAMHHPQPIEKVRKRNCWKKSRLD
ncbi:hypothetical protein DPMN_191575 [Dreissena polymorpha]|uniref:Uncharacterized protein n=1 Tax=Dreissena polymorpha TaxID=45954 RepID=A0A9D3Y324_DREPO|nr:hypothetical protein DPMN_191575 [Dreissena polymorpha]